MLQTTSLSAMTAATLLALGGFAGPARADETAAPPEKPHKEPKTAPSENPESPAVYDIRRFGAVGDGKTDNTAAMQKSIDACTAAGGGRVLVSGGRYVIGTIYLKDNVDLHVDGSAALLGSTDYDDYATDTFKSIYGDFNRCLIFARGASNIALTGLGTIDGQGKGHFPNSGDSKLDRPMLIRFVECSRLRLRDLELRNSGSWISAWNFCRDIVVDGVSIRTRNMCPNGDGLDFDGCRDVRVSNVVFDTSDDAICLQASRTDQPCHNVTICNCIMSSRWAAIRIGLSSLGDLRDVTVSNCVFHDIDDAGLKIQMSEGGVMEDMIFSNLIMRKVPMPVFMTFNSWRAGVDSPKPLPPMNRLSDMQFSGIRVDNTGLPETVPTGFVLTGVPGHYIERITFEDVSMRVAGGGTPELAAIRDIGEFVGQRPEFWVLGKRVPYTTIFARHVRGLSLSNVRFEAARPEARPAVLCQNVQDLELAGLRCGKNFNGEAVIRLRQVQDAVVRDCRSLGTAASFVRLDESPADSVTVASDNRFHAGRAVSQDQ